MENSKWKIANGKWQMANMYLRCFFPAIVLITIASNSLAQSVKQKSTSKNMNGEKEIIQIENEIFEAIKNKDAKKLESIVVEDFVYRTHDGQQANKTAFLENIKSFKLKILSVKGEHLNAEVYGDVAVLTGIQRAKVEMEDGKIVEGIGAFTDVFIKRNNRWMLKSAFHVELPAVTETEKKDE
jgi:ketosteroid isomerase-like protein